MDFCFINLLTFMHQTALVWPQWGYCRRNLKRMQRKPRPCKRIRQTKTSLFSMVSTSKSLLDQWTPVSTWGKLYAHFNSLLVFVLMLRYKKSHGLLYLICRPSWNIQLEGQSKVGVKKTTVGKWSEVYAAQPEQPTHLYIFKQKQNSSS